MNLFIEKNPQANTIVILLTSDNQEGTTLRFITNQREEGSRAMSSDSFRHWSREFGAQLQDAFT